MAESGYSVMFRGVAINAEKHVILNTSKTGVNKAGAQFVESLRSLLLWGEEPQGHRIKPLITQHKQKSHKREKTNVNKTQHKRQTTRKKTTKKKRQQPAM